DCRVARRTRRVFESGAGVAFDVHGKHGDWNVDFTRDAAALFAPALTVRVQIVVDMDRAKTTRAYRRHLRERMQQHARVHAAAERNDDCAVRRLCELMLEFCDQRHARMVPEALARDILPALWSPGAPIAACPTHPREGVAMV